MTEVRVKLGEEEEEEEVEDVSFVVKGRNDFLASDCKTGTRPL